ncbi:MAG: ricin-type beta-trefoil lectin domain protein [Bacterioplanes sp.]|nr:ricin-type beta-trefoil lectin domain protein [Bacterioplanes sp.]
MSALNNARILHGYVADNRHYSLSYTVMRFDWSLGVFGLIAAVACDRQKTRQYWRWNDNGTLQNEQTNQCLDFAHHNSTLIMYGCHGGWNQQWSLSASTESLLLNRLSGDAIEQLLSLLTSSDH